MSLESSEANLQEDLSADVLAAIRAYRNRYGQLALAELLKDQDLSF